MIAGYTTLKTLKDNPAIYDQLNDKTNYLKNGLNEVFQAWGSLYN
jgi:glutamate-1-semialdehyde 2,1-aminomutase